MFGVRTMNRLLDLFRNRPKSQADETPLSLAELSALNIKLVGYQTARRLAAGRRSEPPQSCPSNALASKATTQSDLDSEWCAYWARELGVGFAYHRKLWELTYVLQALGAAGCITPGNRGLGFGCGRESIPSYLASKGVSIVATDLPASDSAAAGWIATGQHAAALEELYFSHLVSREWFDAHVSCLPVDMNAIPDNLQDFDFCWSICALEHLGSIEAGLSFIERSLDALKPGGVAVHTTEFAFLNIDKTVEKGATVFYLRKHFEELSARLTSAGHVMAPLDFDVGDGPMDTFIDCPPFPGGPRDHLLTCWPHSYHLKVSFEGIPTTCFGLIIRKAVS